MKFSPRIFHMYLFYTKKFEKWDGTFCNGTDRYSSLVWTLHQADFSLCPCYIMYDRFAYDIKCV